MNVNYNYHEFGRPFNGAYWWEYILIQPRSGLMMSDRPLVPTMNECEIKLPFGPVIKIFTAVQQVHITCGSKGPHKTTSPPQTMGALFTKPSGHRRRAASKENKNLPRSLGDTKSCSEHTVSTNKNMEDDWQEEASKSVVTTESPNHPDKDPRNAEFWEKMFAAKRDEFCLKTLLAAKKYGELEMWCHQFPSIDFDVMEREFSTILEAHDSMKRALPLDLSLTSKDYWMTVPKKKFRYIVECNRMPGAPYPMTHAWMDQIPGCPEDFSARSEICKAISAATTARKLW